MKINFIIGIGRSGTNLLALILRNNPRIESISDVPFISFFKKDLENKKTLTSKDHINIIEYLSYFTNNNEDNATKINHLKSINSYKSYAGLIQQIFQVFSEKDLNQTLLFDKEPSYTFHVEKLLKLFPEAKFIFMTRDYRANYLSRKENPNNRTSNIYLNCYRWKAFNKKGLQFLNRYPDQIILVKYENLVSYPLVELKKIAQFFQFEYTESMFENITDKSDTLLLKNDVNPEFYKTHHNKIAKEINNNRIGKWKEELSKKEIAVCENICGKTGLRLNYPISLPKNNSKFILSLYPYLHSKYDYYKEFILLHIPASIKLKRLKK